MNDENNSQPINAAPKGASTSIDEDKVNIPSPITPIMPDMDFFTETTPELDGEELVREVAANQPPSLAANRLETAVSETNKHLNTIKKMLAVFQYMFAFVAVAAILYIGKNLRPKVV